VVDSSSSISNEDYGKMKAWMKTIVESLNIGPKDSQVSIMQFAGHDGQRLDADWAERVLVFNQATNKESVLSKIDGMKSLGGNTCIGEALQYFRYYVYIPQHGLRDGYTRRVIVLTDGVNNCPYVKRGHSFIKHRAIDIEGEAEKIRGLDASIFAIGVGNRCTGSESKDDSCYNPQELGAIASKPHDTFIMEVDNFDHLNDLKTRLLTPNTQL